MPAELPAKETLPHLIRRALSDSRPDVLQERRDGVWTFTSSERLMERVLSIACAVRDAGLERGDRVAIIAHDCVDWIACDFGVFFAGCVVVPVYPTQAIDNTQYILNHSESKLLFVDCRESVQRLTAAGVSVPRTIVFDEPGEDGLAAFEARGARIRAEHPELPAVYESELRPDDLAVLIYTSGTTGVPKGVMLSHDNLGFDAQSALCFALEGLSDGADVLSVLPFSHIYEHTMIYIYMLARLRYAICHDANHLLDDLRDIRPVAMTCVPRIFDRVLAGVTTKAVKEGGIRAKLVPWALRVGREYMSAKVFHGGAGPLLTVQYAIARKLVLEKVRAMLGLDRMRYFTSGSAALHVDVAMTYLGMGTPIMQGYGLTETSPVITVNHPSENSYGTVGPPIPGVEVKIAPDGEVLARGRNVMQGYYRDPEATAAVIVDGWFHTGDVGEIDSKGFLRITDRKKELFKTGTGKYVSPARVESAIKRSMYVAQAMVVGDGRPFPIALVCPNWEMVRTALTLPDGESVTALAQRDDVVAFLTAEVRNQTDELGSYEQVRRILIIPVEFSVESGELSPSMKIKRRVVEDRYRAGIDAVYA